MLFWKDEYVYRRLCATEFQKTICLPNPAFCCYSGLKLMDLFDMQRFVFFTGHFYFSHSNPKAVE
jgi:hypothetical protein